MNVDSDGCTDWSKDVRIEVLFSFSYRGKSLVGARELSENEGQ